MATTQAPNGATQQRQPTAVDVFKEKVRSNPGIIAHIAKVVPKHMKPERVISLATTILIDTPGLQKCTTMSVIAAVVKSAELGLELSGPLGQAYLVPYGDKATLIVGYRGFVKLAMNTRQVEFFSGACVHDGDFFEFEKGTAPYLKHRFTDRDIDLQATPVSGMPPDITYVYACVRLKGMAYGDFVVMTANEVERHRRRYSKDTRKDAAWQTAWEAMAPKTPIRKLAKTVPLSTEMHQAVDLDELAEAGKSQGLEERYGFNELMLSDSRSDRLAADLRARDLEEAPAGEPDEGDAFERPLETNGAH